MGWGKAPLWGVLIVAVLFAVLYLAVHYLVLAAKHARSLPLDAIRRPQHTVPETWRHH